MELMDYSRFALALLFVLGLIWTIAYGLKRSGLDKHLRGATGQAGRLQIVDVIYMDPRRKLVLARAYTREYLLLVTSDGVTVIDKLGEAHETV